MQNNSIQSNTSLPCLHTNRVQNQNISQNNVNTNFYYKKGPK